MGVTTTFMRHISENVLDNSGSSSWNFNRLDLELRLSAVVNAWLSVNVGTGGTASDESSTSRMSSQCSAR